MVLIAASEPQFRNNPRQLNKLADQLHKGYYNFYSTETWSPNVNLYETDGAYVVCVDLAGVDKEKIDIVVEDQQLTIKGTRVVPTPAEPESPHASRLRVHVMEIDHGAFCREVELPRDVQKEHINATYRNGMLWIELPKR